MALLVSQTGPWCRSRQHGCRDLENRIRDRSSIIHLGDRAVDSIGDDADPRPPDVIQIGRRARLHDRIVVFDGLIGGENEALSMKFLDALPQIGKAEELGIRYKI